MRAQSARLGLDDGFQFRDVAGWLGQGALPPGVADVGQAVVESPQIAQAQRALYTYGVSRPLTTGMLLIDPNDASSEYQGGALQQAWNASEYVSPGQAIVGGFNDYIDDRKQANPKQARDAVDAAIRERRPVGFFDSDGNFRSGFENNPWANLVSGGSDFSFSFLLDPLAVAGKGAKVAKSKVLIREVTEKNAGKLAAEVVEGRGGMGAVMDRMDNYRNYSDFMNDPWIQQSADPDALGASMFLAGDLAALYGSTPKAERARIALAAMGDAKAADELRSSRMMLADQMDNLRSLMGPGEPMPGLFDEYVKADAALARALGRADNAGVVNSKVGYAAGSRVSSWETNRGRQAMRKGDMDLGYPAYRTFKRAAGLRDVHVVDRLAQSRPQGVVRLKGTGATDGYVELQSQLARAKGMAPEAREELLNRWASAATTSERKAAAEAIDRAAGISVAMEYGMSQADAAAYIDSVVAKRAGVMDEAQRNGYLLDVDGVLGEPMGFVHDAQLIGQLSDSVPLLDLDHLRQVAPFAARENRRARVLADAGETGVAVARGTYEGLNWMVDTFWRPLVLIRGGYAPRNIGEAWGRMAGLGVLTKIARDQGPEGVANWFRNRDAGVRSAWARASKGVDSAEYADAKARVANPKMAGKRPVDLGDGIVAEGALTGEAIDEASEATTIARQLRPGDGPTVQQSTWNIVNRPLSVEDGPKAWDDYWESYERVVNRQLATDPVARQLLEGRSRAEVAAWLKRSEQYGLRREKNMSKAQVDQAVTLLANQIDDLVPDFVRADVLDGGLSAKQYAQVLADVDTGAVWQEKVTALLGGGGLDALDQAKPIKVWRGFVNGAFKYIGQKPTDTLVRNPYFTQRYQERLARYKAVALQQMRPDQITSDMVKGWEVQARKAALRDLKNDIYTIERYSNAAASLRLISPFIAATNNTIRVWSRIIGNDPSVAVRAMQLWNSPVRAGLVYDSQTGEFVPQDTPGIGLSSRYEMALPIPGAAKRWAGLPEGYRLTPPLASLNVALQSDPAWLPGWGPMVTVPFAVVANREPTNGAVQFLDGLIFPRQGSIEESAVPGNPFTAALPAWVRQKFNESDPDGTTRARLEAMLWAEAYSRGENVSPEQIAERVDKFFFLRILGSATLPFAAQIKDPEGEFYVAKYREFLEQGEVDGVDPFERFIREFGPQYTAYTFSVTENPTRVSADVWVQRRLDQLDPDLRTALTDANPSLLGLVVNNPDGSSDFNSPVYNSQRGEPTSLSDPTPLRRTQGGKQAVDETQVRAGWSAYIPARRKLDAFMRDRGITSLRSVPGLKAQWDAYVAGLEGQYPAWREARAVRDELKYQRNIEGLEVLLASDDPAARRPEMGTLRRYLDARASLKQFLATQAPARTLTAAANAPLRDQWEAYVSGLVLDDPKFGDIYFQFLDGELSRVED